MIAKRRFFASNKPSLANSMRESSAPKKSYWGSKPKTKSKSKRPFRTGKANKRRRTNKFGVTRIGRVRYADNWPELSRAIRKERGSRCEKCGATERLEVHHIIPISRGGRDVRSNLIVLCYLCHNKRHRHMYGRK